MALTPGPTDDRRAVTGTLPHMAQLDGLRAFAVAAVVVHHFGSDYFEVAFPRLATAGVKLFFVISGFLITSILLHSRDAIANGLTTRLRALGVFYYRRTLRIFPLYYFVVFVALAVNLGPARELATSLLTYTLNLRMAANGWYVAYFAHFWSLAVEEQFYVVWPWLILLLPVRWIVAVVVAATVSSLALRWWYVASDYTLMTDLGTYLYPWMSLDSLGMGALLACLWRSRYMHLLDKWLVPIALPIAAASFLMRGNMAIVFPDTLRSLAFAALIHAAARGRTGIAGRLLEHPVLSFIGKRSYGIYVYHPLVFAMLTVVATAAGVTSALQGWLGVVIALGVTLGLASVSWTLLESPLINLKNRLPLASPNPPGITRDETVRVTKRAGAS